MYIEIRVQWTRTDVYLVSQIEAVQVQCMQIIIYVISRQL